MRFLDTLRATFLTLKRTRAVWLAIVAPIFIVVFRVVVLLSTGEADSSHHAWNSWIEANSLFWYGILLVLAMALDVALLVEIDRAAHSWKYLFALPVSRAGFYVAKLIVAIVLTLLSGVILLGASLVGGALLALLKPSLGFTQSTPALLPYVAAFLLETLAALFMLALYLWLSMRTKNFILPVSLAIVSMMINLIGYGSGPVQRFSPWMYALDIGRLLSRTPQTQPYLGWPLGIVLAISGAGALVFTLLGIREFTRRDIY